MLLLLSTSKTNATQSQSNGITKTITTITSSMLLLLLLKFEEQITSQEINCQVQDERYLPAVVDLHILPKQLLQPKGLTGAIIIFIFHQDSKFVDHEEDTNELDRKSYVCHSFYMPDNQTNSNKRIVTSLVIYVLHFKILNNTSFAKTFKGISLEKVCERL